MRAILVSVSFIRRLHDDDCTFAMGGSENLSDRGGVYCTSS